MTCTIGGERGAEARVAFVVVGESDTRGVEEPGTAASASKLCREQSQRSDSRIHRHGRQQQLVERKK